MTNISVNRVELWRAWRVSRRVIVAALVVTVLCGWSILLWHHPGWIIGFGSPLGLVLGVMLGGMDILTGSEEFSLSLPPTRSRRYLLRAAFGGGVVLAFSVLSTLAIGLDLPQRLWRLVVESGFTEPFGPWEHGFLLYGLAITAPMLAFSCAFVAAARSRSPVGASMAWLPGGLAAGVVILGGFLLEAWIWDTPGVPVGYLIVPLLAIAAVLILAGGKALYDRKEAIPSDHAGGGAAAVIWTAVIVVVLLFLPMFLVISRRSSGPQIQPPQPPAPFHPQATVPPGNSTQPAFEKGE